MQCALCPGAGPGESWPILRISHSTLSLYAPLQRWKHRGIMVCSVHPGNMVSSQLSRNYWFYRLLFAIVRPFTKSLVSWTHTGLQIYSEFHIVTSPCSNKPLPQVSTVPRPTSWLACPDCTTTIASSVSPANCPNPTRCNNSCGSSASIWWRRYCRSRPNENIPLNIYILFMIPIFIHFFIIIHRVYNLLFWCCLFSLFLFYLKSNI